MTFEQLQEHLARLFADSSHTQVRLSEAQDRIKAINIYRPLKAYRALRDLAPERLGAREDAKRIVDGLAKVVMITPDKNMGQTLTSCLDTLRISAEMSHLQAVSVELESSMQQTGAFAFGVFALYVALVSLSATVLLGVLSLVK
jgi:hypothetical protein